MSIIIGVVVVVARIDRSIAETHICTLVIEFDQNNVHDAAAAFAAADAAPAANVAAASNWRPVGAHGAHSWKIVRAPMRIMHTRCVRVRIAIIYNNKRARALQQQQKHQQQHETTTLATTQQRQRQQSHLCAHVDRHGGPTEPPARWGRVYHVELALNIVVVRGRGHRMHRHSRGPETAADYESTQQRNATEKKTFVGRIVLRDNRMAEYS